jgi:hypothetical protein
MSAWAWYHGGHIAEDYEIFVFHVPSSVGTDESRISFDVVI